MRGGHVWSNTNGSYIQYDLVPVTNFPCTFAAWVYRTTNTPDDYNIIQMQDSTASSQYNRLHLGEEGGSPTTFVVSAFNDGGSVQADFASSTEEVAFKGWSHAAGVFESTTLRIGYVNGGFPGTSTTDLAYPTDIDSVSIGREMDNSPGDSFEGSIIWPAIWDVALTPQEIKLLGQGFPPWEMRKQNLRFCARLDGSQDEFRDMVTNAFPVPVSTEAGTVPIKLEGGRIALPEFLIPKRTLFAHTQDYFPIDVQAEASSGDILEITLVDAAGSTLNNLTGISWAWFDQSTVNSASTPTATGTGATTNASGLLSLDITGTALTSGQTGMLALQDSTGYIYAWYRVTL